MQQKIRLLILVALMCLPAIVAAQETPRKGESTISGRVIFADTGKPVRRATVGLFSNLNRPAERTTPANARGEFRFNDVAAGSYFVMARVPGGFSPVDRYVVTEFGINSDADVENTRVVVDGKGSTRCEVRVIRAGTIMGTIVYADKEPVTGAQIMLFRRKNGATTRFIVEPVHTNDRGMYRIDGLPEGEYFVAVSDSRRRVTGVMYPDARDLVSAYYPGVSGISEAKAVQVQPGSEAGGINITLNEDGLRQISGVVKWRDGGRPAAKASLVLRRADEPMNEGGFERFLAPTNASGDDKDDVFRDFQLLMSMLPPRIEANNKGEWKFEDLPAGKYVLTAYASLVNIDNAAARDDVETEEGLYEVPSAYAPRRVSRRIEVTVGDEDLKDVVVEVSAGGRISGVVVAEGAPPPRIHLSIALKGAEIADVMSNYESDEIGGFLLEGVPGGDVRLQVLVPFTEDYYVKSIMLGNQDLMRNPVRVEEGHEVTGVRIALGKGRATVTGRALFKEDGAIAAGSGVLLVRADPALWQLSGSQAFALTNPEGEFVLQCPPGDYFVFTWRAGNPPVQPIEEFVRSNAASARRITLQSREEKRIELTVVKPK